jgi:hypothetical protein
MPRLLFPVAVLVLLCAASSARAITAIGGQPVIDTAITAGPLEGAATEDETPTFSFSATRDGAPYPTASFYCSVDGAPAEPCASPYELAPLEEEGQHSFSVYAEDPVTATRDPVPASRTFFLEFEEEECEAGEEFEDEEGNVEECEAETGPYPPAECLLHTARARIFTYTDQEKVRLVIRYTSFAPADVAVDYSLNGARGSLKLGEAKAHFAKRGVLRLSETLSPPQMAKVLAAKRFTVDLNIPATPRLCRRYDTRHLTIRRTVRSRVVWFQSDSIFGARP